MEMYFFRPDEWNRLYLNGCLSYDINLHPLEERRHILLGSIYLFLFFFYQILYIPCIFAIWKRTKQSCYKLMFFIGITDSMCLIVNALFTGYGAITGNVFCSYPTWNYWIGIAGTFLWVIESTADMVLALNRCVGVISPKAGDFFFEGNRTWLWLIPVSLYSLYFIVFTKPVIFTGIFVTWYFNPHAGYIIEVGESEYRNELHTFHNILVFFGISGLYTAFTLAMILKYIGLRGALNLSVAERMTFMQTFAISFFNGLAAGVALYVQFQFMKIGQILMDIGAYAWTTAHGMPGVIYIAANKTIRNDCVKMLKCKKSLNAVTPQNS